MENLADCIRMWMVDYKKNSVKPSTYDRLIVSRKLLERYTLAWMPTDRITVDDIQRFVNELVRDGYAWTTIKKEGAGMSEASAVHVRRCILRCGNTDA